MEGGNCYHPRAVSWFNRYSSIVCDINRDFCVSKQVFYWGKGTYCRFRICLLSTKVRNKNLEILSVSVVGSVCEAIFVHEEYSQVIGSCCGSTCQSSEPSFKACLIIEKQRGFKLSCVLIPNFQNNSATALPRGRLCCDLRWVIVDIIPKPVLYA